ncbi:MAG: hypothetical protein J5485_03375 [Candidatus Methanomethylophilaceae archaeon]|nr:hypothetical protein [Candidatus Methanomethylophilaceae archaeon]
MAIPADPMEIDLGKAAETLSSKGWTLSQMDEMMAVFKWNGMDVTLYPQGKMMFFPLEDRASCIKYATEALGSLRAVHYFIYNNPMGRHGCTDYRDARSGAVRPDVVHRVQDGMPHP